MKTISELQQEIHSMRENLIQTEKRLSVLDTELSSFKDSLQDSTNYQHIYNLAETMPMIHHPVVALPQKEKSIYFGALLMIATLEDSISDQQLLFLQRMVMADSNCKQIDYYMGNLGRIQLDNVIYCLSDKDIITNGNRLLLDMIMVAKLGKNCSDETYSVISDIASILEKTTSEFMVICRVAVALLLQDVSRLPKGVLKTEMLAQQYGYYLNELDGWEIRLDELQRYLETKQQEQDQRNLFMLDVWKRVN